MRIYSNVGQILRTTVTDLSAPIDQKPGNQGEENWRFGTFKTW